jgi:outer membrane assembly lipoprotein YfiO
MPRAATKSMILRRLAAREMTVGRWYMVKRDYTAAINRFNGVVRQYPTSTFVEEALAGLAEAYLTMGITREAQTAGAVLARKFPRQPLVRRGPQQAEVGWARTLRG